MAAVLAVGMPDEFPYDLGGGGGDDYNLGTRPTEVSLDPGAGKVSLVLCTCTYSSAVLFGHVCLHVHAPQLTCLIVYDACVSVCVQHTQCWAAIQGVLVLLPWLL